VKVCVLVGAARDPERVIVVKHSEISPSLGPDVIWLGWVDVQIVAARGGQHAVIVTGVGDLAADIRRRAVDHGIRSPVNQTVDERRVGVLVDLLDVARELRKSE